MNIGTEILLSALILIGAVFTFVGSLGLVRFEDFYTRLHAPTKATTLGVGCLLIASSVFFSVTGEAVSLHEILVSVFLFITAPISAHLLAKAALHLALPSVAPLPDKPSTLDESIQAVAPLLEPHRANDTPQSDRHVSLALERGSAML